MKVRVVHVIIGLETGGAEMILFRLVSSHLNNPRYSHTVVSLSSVGKLGKKLRAQGIVVKSLEMRSVLHVPISFFRLLSILIKEKPDIIQTWMYHADLFGGLAAKILGHKNIIWGIRNTDVFSRRGVSFFTSLIMRLCAALSRIIPHTIVCVAHSAKNSHKKLGYDDRKMVVIHNGFDVNKFNLKIKHRSELRKRFGIKANSLIIGSVARYNEYKDHKSLIYAAKKILITRKDVCFVLVGKGINNENEELMELIKNTNNEKNFILMGERDDIPLILATFDLFCLHSVSEGFPNVLGEAMAAGIPCIATDVGDASVLMGDNGFIVPSSNYRLLSRKLVTMMGMNKKERKHMGKLGQERIKNFFSQKRTVKAYENLYSRVLKL